MYKAEVTLVLFKILGIWPVEYTKGCLTIYTIYSIFIASIVVVFITLNAIYILNENIDSDDYMENFFYAVGVFTASLKMLIIYRRRSKIQKIMKRLDSKQFEPRDSEEIDIQNKYDKIGRFLFKQSSKLQN